jgi:transposase
MNGDILVMRQRELNRLDLIKKAIAKQLTQLEASKLLGISLRQAQRIVRRVRDSGDKGIIHQKRGKPNCRRISEVIKAKVLRVYGGRYKDFGATLASEKLAKNEGIKLSRETLRKWLRAEGYEAFRRRRRKHRQWRERKAYCGQMVQMDGSHHDWLEGRGPKLVLMGYIDDASNRIFGRFYEYEGTIPALDSFKRYCLKHGIPQSVYLDKHSTYKATIQDQLRLSFLGQGDGLSIFERALEGLDVQVIHANSPQAKGRIERLFRTLQDRLVKELRLANAGNIEEANDVLEGYLKEHNDRYAVVPVKKTNLHRRVSGSRLLDESLCIKTRRIVRNDFTVIHNKRLYQILQFTSAKELEVREHLNGCMEFIGPHQNRMKFKEIKQRPEVKPKSPWTINRRVNARQRIRQLLNRNTTF